MILLKNLCFLTLTSLTCCRTSPRMALSMNLAGQYASVDNKFERSSVLRLNNDSTFIYYCMLGGCRDEINGKWFTKNKSIYLRADTSKNTIYYRVPDLYSISWTITKKGVKPSETINVGCIKEHGLHLKVNSH